jgi:hypothetical protein
VTGGQREDLQQVLKGLTDLRHHVAVLSNRQQNLRAEVDRVSIDLRAAEDALSDTLEAAKRVYRPVGNPS